MISRIVIVMAIVLLMILAIAIPVMAAENECCSKWKTSTWEGKFSAYTNEGWRTHVKIEYCPECGDTLRRVFGYYVAVVNASESPSITHHKFFRYKDRAYKYYLHSPGATEILFDVIYEDQGRDYDN